METFAPGSYEGRIGNRTREYITADGVQFVPWSGGLPRIATAFDELLPIGRVKEHGERAFLAYVEALEIINRCYVADPLWDRLGESMKQVWANVETECLRDR